MKLQIIKIRFEQFHTTSRFGILIQGSGSSTFTGNPIVKWEGYKTGNSQTTDNSEHMLDSEDNWGNETETENWNIEGQRFKRLTVASVGTYGMKKNCCNLIAGWKLAQPFRYQQPPKFEVAHPSGPGILMPHIYSRTHMQGQSLFAKYPSRRAWKPSKHLSRNR